MRKTQRNLAKGTFSGNCTIRIHPMRSVTA